MIEKFARQKLAQYSSNEIYYVSALNALEGKMENDTEKYEKSGMKEFEGRLSQFLTKEKGKVKLAQPARELKRIINEEALFKTIPSQKTMLSASLDDLKAKYDRAKPRLTALETKKKQILDKLIFRIEQSKSMFKRAVVSNCTEISNLIPVWVNEANVTSSLGIMPGKEKVTAYVSELTGIISGRVEDQQAEWKNSVFAPLIEEKANDIISSIESELKDFYAGIDKVQSDINGGMNTDEEAPIWERIAGMSGALFLGNIGVSNVDGLGASLAKTIAVGVGGGFLLSMLGMLNPITIVIAIIGAIVFGGGGSEKKVKNATSQEIVKSLSASIDEQAEAISIDIAEKLTEIADCVSVALDAEINECRSQVDLIIAELEKGQANVDEKMKKIDRCEAEIKDISKMLDTFIFALMR